MPELPEVEVTRRALEPALCGVPIERIEVRAPRLRYPVPVAELDALAGQAVLAVRRRGKYLLLDFATGCVLVHLGMSGSLRVVRSDAPGLTHEHVAIVLAGGVSVRLRDPRRFGAVLWVPHPAEAHPLLAPLGVEPLAPEFDGPCLAALCAGRRTPIKLLIMDSHRLVGVGNIYASESLFRAGLHPALPAGRLTAAQCARLVQTIRATLQEAIAAGGSSLRDFVHSDGSSGHFQQQTAVYGRAGEACRVCGRTVERLVQGARATFFCPGCQRRPRTRP